MKKNALALAVLPLILAACQATDIQKVGDHVVTVVQQPSSDQSLTSYYWSTNTGAPKPLILKFDDQGRLFISTSCNNLATGWVISDHKIVTGNIAATMMACPEQATQQEQLANQIFANKQINFSINTQDVLNPTLTLFTPEGQSYVFTGKMTPETKYQSQGEIMFFEISPQTKSCSSSAGQCLQVREIKYANNGVKLPVDSAWKEFNAPIEGFQHNLHEQQIIRVKRYAVKNTTVSQAPYAYILDLVVERRSIS